MFDTLHHVTEVPDIGTRIEMRRRQHGLSRRVVANLVGRSEEWLRLVETGRQRLDSIELILRLADVLRIDDVNELINASAARIHRTSAGAVRDPDNRLRAPVLSHPVLAGDAAAPRSVAHLVEALHRCEQAWEHSPQRYTLLDNELPSVITDCRCLNWHRRGPDSTQMLIRTYNVARRFLTRSGDHGLAWTVADRAMTMAARTGEPVWIAAGAWQVGNALLGMSQASDCRHYAVSAAGYLSKEAPDSPDHATIWGALYLLAAEAATQAHDFADAQQLTRVAEEVADSLGTDHTTLGILFGPTEIGIAQIVMALHCNNLGEAIRTAARVEVTDDYHLSGRIRYHVALAAAHARHGDDMAATFALAKAAQACPEDLRRDRDAHTAITHLIRRGNRTIGPDVARLAAIAGAGSAATI